MAELLAELPDCDASDRVPTATDLSELEPPSKKKKTGECSSENEGGVDDSRSNDDGWTTRYLETWVWSGDYSWASCLLRSPSSENEGGVDDSRSNDDGWTTRYLETWVWSDDYSWAACLLRSGGVDDSRSNDDGWTMRYLETWVWSGDDSWAACLLRSPSSENEGGIDDSRSNDEDDYDDYSWAACLLCSGGVDDSRSNDDGWTTSYLETWVWSDDYSWAACLLRSGGVDDSRSNDYGWTTRYLETWVWSGDYSWAACLLRSPSSGNEGGVHDSRSNGDGWMPDDPLELGQLALFPVELEPPFSGKESNEINGVEGSREVRSVAGKCPVRHPKAAQLLSASSSNSDSLDVNLRMEGRHPPPLLLWLRDMFSQPIHYPPAGTIFGNLKPENVSMTTGRLFCGQLSYIKKNNMDPFLVKSTPEAEDLFSRLLKKNPESRLEAREVILHPFSWRSNVKLRFLRRMNARLLSKYSAPSPDLLTELQSNEPLIFHGNWIDKLDLIFKTYILQRKEKYDFSSVMELVRFMRNKSTHLDELPENIKELVGKGDESFYNYFAPRFPRLLMKLYGAAFQFCREEEWFKVFRVEHFPEYCGSDAL